MLPIDKEFKRDSKNKGAISIKRIYQDILFFGDLGNSYVRC